MHTVTIVADGARHDVPCNRIARLPNHELAILDVAGPQGQIRSLHACLNQPGDTRISHSAGYPFTNLGRSGCGYASHWHRLPHGCLHLVVMVKLPGLLPLVSQRGLWNEIMGDNYTSPMMFHWVPWVGKRLGEEGLLAKLDAIGCEPGLITASTEQIDEIVHEGLITGHLEVPEQEVVEVT